MIGKLFVILSIFLIIINIPTVSFSQDTSLLPSKEPIQQKEYVSNNMGLKIKYDNPWTISPNSSPKDNCDSCIIVLQNKNNPSLTMSLLAENLSYFDDKCDCKYLKDFVLTKYGEKYKPAAIVSITDNQTKIAHGISAWHMEYVLSNDNKHYMIWFIVNNILYEINFEINKSSYERYFPEIRTIIDSLEFFPPHNKQNTQQQNSSEQTQQSSSPLDQLTSLFDKSDENNLPSTSSLDNDVVEVSIAKGASVLTDTAYQPNPIEIEVGQTIKWTNNDSAFHTVTSGQIGAANAGREFDSGLVGSTALTSQGKTFEHAFDKSGEFDYHCILHPNMMGKVIVN